MALRSWRGWRCADAQTGREVLSQAVDEDGDGTFDRLVFQADFGPGETREFRLQPAEPRKPRLADFRVYGRFVRERHDDFAWENDRVGVPPLRRGARDLRRRAAHEQRRRRVEQEHAAGWC